MKIKKIQTHATSSFHYNNNKNNILFNLIIYYIVLMYDIKYICDIIKLLI